MNQRTSKQLRKVFKDPEGYKRFKKALKSATPEKRKKALQTMRSIVSSGKEIHIGELPHVG